MTQHSATSNQTGDNNLLLSNQKNPLLTAESSTHLKFQSAENSNQKQSAELRKSNQNEYWIKELCLFMADKAILESATSWLTDSIIYAASILLSKLNEDIGGWQSPQLGRNLGFKHIVPGQKFIQVLHDRDHWVTASNILIQSGGETCVTDSVQLFDSYQSSTVSMNLMKQVCGLIRPKGDQLNLDIVNLMPQPNGCDCGIFVIACGTELVYGHDPAPCYWNVSLMRQHLKCCFESGKMIRFPTTKQRRIPLGGRVKHMVSEKIYCICRMPNEKMHPMIQCESCYKWFHFDCVNYDSSLDWKCSTCKQFLEDMTV